MTNEIITRAEELGEEAGANVGSWVEFSTPDEAYAFIRGYENGDDQVLEMCPSPLSGEFADTPTPLMLLQVLGFNGYDDESDEILTAYENGYTEKWWEAALSSAYKVGGVCAVVYEQLSEFSLALYDFALTWETAQTMANEGYRVIAVADDGHMTKDQIQSMCDNENALRADCFGS